MLVTSHGHVIARIIPEMREPKSVDWSLFFEENPPVKLLKNGIPTSELIRKIRDEDL